MCIGSVVGAVSLITFEFCITRGDIEGIVDSSGTRVVGYTYDAWGKILNVSGSMTSTLGALNPLRYRGYVYDTESELYYLQSRYYNPELCRFINADAFVSTGQGFLGYNMYVYCGNSPVARFDSFGNKWSNAYYTYDPPTSGPPLSLSNIGGAPDYVELPAGSEEYAPNCYAAAIGLSYSADPGQFSRRDIVTNLNIYDTADAVMTDLAALGGSARILSSIDSYVAADEYRIALRVSKENYIITPSGEIIYDYHFMWQTSSGAWADKHGNDNPSVLCPFGCTPNDLSWNINGVNYEGQIIYLAVKRGK